jgi:hypothetical protein
VPCCLWRLQEMQHQANVASLHQSPHLKDAVGAKS